ncbi:MAG TPA: hypothetical protein VJ992_08115 [Gemmatimonadales bacterium]|nr:hypothetical protein [Gemmatimonadales bacterium]
MREHRDSATVGGIKRVALRAEAGAAGGLVAAVVVAALFLVDGAIHLHPLAVPEALASGLLGGGNGASGAISQAGSFAVVTVEVTAYTVVHLLTFAAVGATAAFVIDISSFWKGLLGSVAYVGIACTGLLYFVRWMVDTPVALDVLGLPRVIAANAVAGAIIGTALYLGEHGDADEVPA